ncbi:MAG: hypothetical protein IIC41_01970 [Candidatus Marinimicrobia bacterium]|nr:hypothetical protein [Candidatus Neomarinimicrobiota bacterium]
MRTTAATLADTELRNTTPLPPAAAPVPEAQDQAAVAPVVEATTTPLEITTPERLAGPDPIVPAPQGTGETTLPEPVAGPAEVAAPEETAPAPEDDAEPAVAPAPAEENAEQQRAAALLVELTNRARIAFEAQQQDSRTTGPGAGTNTNLSDQLIR